MSTRALPDLIARIRVDSTGVNQSLESMVASFGRANMSLAGLGAGIGLLILGGKSMIDIAAKHEKAELSLAQAIESRNAATGPVIADMSKVITATEHLHLVTRQLAEFDAGHKGHKMTTLDLMHRQDAVAKVTAATQALNQAQKDANRITQETTINSVTMQSQIEDFIKTNRRYISDQSEVIEGAAKLTRAGLTQAEVQKDLGRAVDLSALKHISLSEAVDLLVKAEQGRLRGLIDLGISSGKFTDAQGNLVNGTKDVSRAMAELDERVKKGRDSLSEEEQAMNSMGITWQKFALGPGKDLHRAFVDAIEIGDLFLQMLDKMGSNNPAWDSLQNSLISSGNALKKWYRENSGDKGVTLLGPDYSQYGPGLVQTSAHHQDNRAGGGPVLPNSIYTVGESGPETLVMGARGGYVIPGSSGGGGDLHVTVNAETNADPYRMAAEVGYQVLALRRTQ